MTRAQPLIQTLPMTLGAPMSDDPSNPTAIEIPLQIELPNGQTLFAAVALGGLPFDGQRQIAERIAAAWNAFTGVTTEEIKAPVKCLLQIAEPTPTEVARAEFEAFSKFSKCEWSLDWDKAGFYLDVKVDAAFIWFMHGYMRSPRAAAPQAVQPAVPFMHGIADGCGNAYFEEGCVAPEARDLQPEVDGLNSRLDDDERPYSVVPLYTQPAAQGLHSQSEWEEMHTLPTCDDLIWLYCQDTNTIDGPIAPDPSIEQYGWTHWAYANAPSTAGIDAAQAKQGGRDA